MSINKNRKFRFKFEDYEDSLIDPDEGSKATSIVKNFNEVKIHDHKAEKSESAQMDKQTQARLSAMAKQAKENGGNSGDPAAYADYLSKIPAKQDNMITMSIAGDKVKELKGKMNDEIKNTSGDNATADILSETANDNIVYKNYDMSDLDKYTECVDSMTMLESISLKNSVTKELNRLESCHTMIKAVSDLRENFDVVAPGKEPTMMDRKAAGTNVDKQILTANYLDEYGYNESAEEFAQLYDAYKPKLEALAKKIDEHIDSCKDKAASTKYMTNDFLHIIDKKINDMKSTDINYEYNLKKLQTLKNAFSNRTDLTFLTNKLKLFIQNKSHLKNLAKAMTGTFSGIASKLNKNFSEKSLSALIKVIDRDFSCDMYYIIPFLYFLDYICTSEAKSNNDVWVKIFVLNMSDINNDIWDLDMNDSEYEHSVMENLYPMMDTIRDYLILRKVKISSQIIIQHDKLLNWVPAKTANTEETTETRDEPEEDIEHVEAEVVDISEAHGTFDTTRKEIIDVDPVE